jgi:hypothetical protein
MVFEVAGEVFEEEFAEIHAESVAQNCEVSLGAKAHSWRG